MIKPDILFENEDFIALNKPAGTLSIPDREGKEPSLKSWLREKYGNIFTVHRLDRETSGVIIFAKHEEAHKYFSKIFEERSVEKIYQGIVQGTPPEQKGSIDLPIMEHPAKPGTMVVNKKGKPSLTDYEVIETIGPYSLLQFRIHTGRTHQIRVHLQALGHPIACDDLYSDGRPILLSTIKRHFKLSKAEEQERPLLARLALHSLLLHFQDARGQFHTLEAPLPKDLRALLQQLRKWKS
ncbi:MAG TPA: RluA family pseudouridine synthase [Puia sp.]|jgi:23S rRNA pseudouridine955/2504/2580 synthase/23S rRNA pseudouridine1911/1915/1917 synthase|nr:RluA family pseudouridine synthase [Puia sp.]